MTGKHSHSKTILFGFIAILALFCFYFLKNLAIPESQYNFLNKTKKITLHSGKPVTQTFTALENHLAQIRFAVDNLSFPREASLELTLLDATCSQTLHQQVLTSAPSRQGAYTLFSFSPIADSAGHSYCFRVLYTNHREKKGEKPALLATDEPYQYFNDRILTDQFNEKSYPGQTLFLRPAYSSGSLIKDLAELENRLSQYKPGYAKGWILTIGLIFLLGSIGLGSFIISLSESSDVPSSQK